MNSPSTRVCKRRALQRQKPDSHPNLPVPIRRSARLQPKQRPTTSIPQSLLKHRPTAPQTSNTHTPVPSRAQRQVLPQTYTYQTRKRGSNGSIENSPERPSRHTCLTDLTERNLKAFTKLENTRREPKKELKPSSCSEPKSSHSESKSNESKSLSKTVSIIDSGFAYLAFENGILDPINSIAPSNLDYRQTQLDRARDSESPTESEYDEFSYRLQKAPNEMSMFYETSTLLKRYERGYLPVHNQALCDFPKNIGFNNRLSAAQPDMVEGLDLRQFRPFPVRRELGGAAVPTQERDPPTLSHFAGEYKGPGKDMICAETQAAYDGACLVYGRNQTRLYLGNPDPPGHAFVSTFITDGTTLKTYAHYSSESQGQIEYHQYPTSTSLLRASYEDFKTARRRLRNDQGVAKENSETLRDELIDKWSANQQYIQAEDREG